MSAGPIARKILDAWLLGKLPDGLQPLDSAQGTTALGANAFVAEQEQARQAGEREAAALPLLPVQLGASLLAAEAMAAPLAAPEEKIPDEIPEADR